jgi:cysteinyl-tRNA synthetase
MRLYDTLTRSQVELPAPPGPIGMYVCGSTVYQRIHVGNSRPFVLAMWLRNWLRETEYEVTLVHNITDFDD